jgi:hypothetical protein
MLKTANLPKPSDDILQFLTEMTSTDMSRKKYDLQFNFNGVSELSQQCDRNIITPVFLISPLLTSMLRAQYGSFFKNHIINPFVIILENTNPTSLGFLPPHYDERSMIALNYCLRRGGDNAKFSVYNEREENYEVKYVVKDWADLTPTQQYSVKTGDWYSFDTKRFHSIDNIETTRILLTMRLMNATLPTNGPPTYNTETDSFDEITAMYSDIFQDFNS